MTTPTKRWLLDANVWIFGLRRDPRFASSGELLDRAGSFTAVIPRQVLKELNVNFTDEEARDFYQFANDYSENIELSWEPVPVERVMFYEERACKKGDAVSAAHAEALGVNLTVTENRRFLQTIADLRVQIPTPGEACDVLSFAA